MPCGFLKDFIDRTYPIWPELEGKSCAVVAVTEECVGKAISNLKNYCSVCSIRLIRYVNAQAKVPVKVSKDKNVERRLKRLATKLVTCMDA